MIPTQQLETFPPFAETGSKSKPEDAKYAAGFVPADVLPAEWENWLWNKASASISKHAAGLASVEAELNNVVGAGGGTPSESTNNQVLNAIKYLIAQAKTEAIDDAHPVGSIELRADSTNPGTLYGGTWVQISQGRVLVGAGTGTDSNSNSKSFTAGATGGEYDHTLTSNEMPQHTHTFTGTAHTHTFTGSAHTHTFTGTAVTSGANNRGHTHSYAHTHGYTPGGTIGNGGTHYHFSLNNNNGVTYSDTKNNGTICAEFGTTNFNVNYADRICNTAVLKGQEVLFPLIDYGTSSTIMNNKFGHWIDGQSDGSSSIGPNIDVDYYLYAYTTSTTDKLFKVSSWSGYHNHTFTGSAGTTTSQSTTTSGAESQNHTHSVTAAGTNANTTAGGTNANETAGGNNSNAGGSLSHNNIQPYLVCYIWKRTA